MRGTILQVNISAGGVPKRPIPEGMITPLGVEGDSCANTKVHGGRQQAILIVCEEAIEDLKALGYPIFPGALGENLTTRGLDRHQIRAGQRYRAGDAILEITKLRRPCDTLQRYGHNLLKDSYDQQVKAGDSSAAQYGLVGFYAAVVRGGRVSPGAPIALLEELA
jgi:MOSC domain-containing protein YiiM